MYGEICAQFYDLDKPYAPALALEWYCEALKGRGRVFEPMCGSGRFLVAMLKRGFEVDGADPSTPMLQRCRDKLAAAGELGYQPQLFEQSMQELDTPGGYAAAFIPSGSFGLIFEPAAAQAALTHLRSQLSSGAPVLIEFELPHPEINWPGEAVKTVTQGGTQIRLVSRVEYDFASQLETYHNVYELKQSGTVVQTEDETFKLRCYAPDEMRTELEKAGCRDIVIDHPDFGWVARAHA
ncbi:MAG: class I SAM-dependent methyltransferase [Planctomycetes bacterium]|nr:class I SAM-dependent methyltransferase [Planctomycetota bacterium]